MKKLTKSQIDEVVELTSKTMNNHLRYGQCFFNCLYKLYPEVADSVRATDFDPFYKDSKVQKCIEFILE